MKIYSFSTFYNENEILEIKFESEKDWVDEIHIIEANRTFRNTPKDYNFLLPKNAEDCNKIKYHKMDVSNKFLSNNIMGKARLAYKRISSSFYQHIICHPAWYNESIQRSALGYYDMAHGFEDDDILIFSDLDEILMSDKKDELIKQTFSYGIITVKLYFTMFYFNLFSENWSGPPQYSYRTFLMTGKYFKEHKIKFDKLRKFGENNRLNDKVYCYPEVVGFHHSWIGDEEFVAKKLASYSHIKEHEDTSAQFIENCIRDGVSLFPGHVLSVNNDIKLLPYIENNREDKFSKYF